MAPSGAPSGVERNFSDCIGLESISLRFGSLTSLVSAGFRHVGGPLSVPKNAMR